MLFIEEFNSVRISLTHALMEIKLFKCLAVIGEIFFEGSIFKQNCESNEAYLRYFLFLAGFLKKNVTHTDRIIHTVFFLFFCF